MTQTTIPRWPRLSFLIFAAGYASASLTLTNFNKIPDDVTSRACRSAYNTPLENCKVDDFTNNACSSQCRASISKVEDAIEERCATVTVSDTNSLLYRALKGQLEDVLCVSDDSSHKSDDASTTTTVQAVTSNTNKNQVMETSTITTQTTAAATTSEAAQTTSLELAGGDKSTGVLESAVSSSAKSTETSSSGRGGDPFANNTGAGASLVVGYTTLVMSALLCMVAVM